MAESKIEWTDATWNPVAGCSIMSPGCANCYAMRMAARLEAMGVEKYAGLTRKTGGRAKWTGRIRVDEAALVIPQSWKKPRRVFVNSMSDLFHPDVPLDFVLKVWEIMRQTPRHTYQILTKRPDVMHAAVKDLPILDNVWLGTSVEDDAHLGRIEILRQVPSRIRFVSFEPLIGPVTNVKLDGIHWAIVGGESGPSARPIETGWVDEIKDACAVDGAAFFFKQWGGVNKKMSGRVYNDQVWNEMPHGTSPENSHAERS
jgi:protein gp37